MHSVPVALPEEHVDRLKDVDDEEKTVSDISPHDQTESHEYEAEDKVERPASLELTRTESKASQALSRVTSRITNRHIVDPGPAPGTYSSL